MEFQTCKKLQGNDDPISVHSVRFRRTAPTCSEPSLEQSVEGGAVGMAVTLRMVILSRFLHPATARKYKLESPTIEFSSCCNVVATSSAAIFSYNRGPIGPLFSTRETRDVAHVVKRRRKGIRTPHAGRRRNPSSTRKRVWPVRLRNALACAATAEWGETERVIDGWNKQRVKPRGFTRRLTPAFGHPPVRYHKA